MKRDGLVFGVTMVALVVVISAGVLGIFLVLGSLR